MEDRLTLDQLLDLLKKQGEEVKRLNAKVEQLEGQLNAAGPIQKAKSEEVGRTN